MTMRLRSSSRPARTRWWSSRGVLIAPPSAIVTGGLRSVMGVDSASEGASNLEQLNHCFPLNGTPLRMRDDDISFRTATPSDQRGQGGGPRTHGRSGRL